MRSFKLPLSLTLGLLSAGCAQLHHIQLSDISNRTQTKSAKVIDIKVSETGVNIQEIAGIAKAFSNRQGSAQIQKAQDIIGLFQMGPRTGIPVFVENYWQGIPKMIETECPSGQVSNVISMRETRKYPVVSGEIALVKAICISGQ